MEFAEPAEVTVEYSATVAGLAEPEEPTLAELIRYVRPSRYAESDRLLPTAYAEFGGLHGEELLQAVGTGSTASCGTSAARPGGPTAQWKRSCTAAAYAGTSRTWPSRCCAPRTSRHGSRPSMRRACAPMDFHAVAEAHVNGAWHVIDPTGLAPRESMLRITAGRDSSDTAFLSTVGGQPVPERAARHRCGQRPAARRGSGRARRPPLSWSAAGPLRARSQARAARRHFSRFGAARNRRSFSVSRCSSFCSAAVRAGPHQAGDVPHVLAADLLLQLPPLPRSASAARPGRRPGRASAPRGRAFPAAPPAGSGSTGSAARGR